MLQDDGNPFRERRIRSIPNWAFIMSSLTALYSGVMYEDMALRSYHNLVATYLAPFFVAINFTHNNMNKLTTEEFIARAKEVHGDKYDYSQTNYIGSKAKVAILCKKHGCFNQIATDHLRGCGCHICGFEAYRNDKWKGKSKSGLVEGIGINDIPNIESSVAYRTWQNILRRCYNKVVQEKQPRYKGCIVCDEWLTFSNFKAWYENPENGYHEGYQLDKDIIVRGNKVYSPDTCCLVPQAINVIFGYYKKKTLNLPHGVFLHYNKYRAVLNYEGRNHYLGVYNTPEEAFSVYKQAKESYIKSVAEIYFKRGEITLKTYLAMMRYEIE